ncbi:unnamed protein product [Ascophyllum nodosum]
MRIGLATAKALGFVTRQARRGRRPCVAEPRGSTGTGFGGARNPQRGARISTAPEGRQFEEYIMHRSQIGATTLLATQVRAFVSGAGSFSLELEGEGDDDDGT